MFALDAFLDSLKSALKALFIIFASAAITVALLGCDGDSVKPQDDHVRPATPLRAEVDQLPDLVALKMTTSHDWRYYEGLIVFESYGDGFTILAERNKSSGGNWVKTLTPVDISVCDLERLIVEPPWLRPRLLECGETLADRAPELEPWAR